MPDTPLPFELRPDATPLFVLTHGARVAKEGERLRITLPAPASGSGPVAEPAERLVRLSEVSHLVLIGNVDLTTPCLHMLMRCGVPVAWLDGHGWYLGRTVGCPEGEAAARRSQYRAADLPERRLEIARRLVAAKIANCRTRLRRRGALLGFGDGGTGEAVRQLRQLAEDAAGVGSRESLFGIEGTAAAIYFSAFRTLIRPPQAADAAVFKFERRTRRPPQDAVSALLSYAYGVLTRDLAAAVATEGLDVQVGFLHDVWRGRPSLALDLMEPFRPLIADGAVLEAINSGAVSGRDFERGNESEDGPDAAGTGRGIMLSPAARRALVQTIERRLDREVTPGFLQRKLSYRAVLLAQVRQLSRYLREETNVFDVFQVA